MSTRREIEKSYGLDPGEYDWLDVDGNCWICEQPESVQGRSLAIDHDHETGAVRGLLCTRCNQVLGRMRDDPNILRRAADYLDRSRAAFSDGCHECLPVAETTSDWIFPPKIIIETDGHRTRFGYECRVGHRWTCSYLTKGVPIAWQV